MAHLGLYGVAMAQSSGDQRILVQMNSLTGLALAWYTQLDLSKIRTWDDLVITFIAITSTTLMFFLISMSYKACTRRLEKVLKSMPNDGELTQTRLDRV